MNKKIEIIGGKRLAGDVYISGSKNAALGVLAAAILCRDQVTISNLPKIQDIDDFFTILKGVGVEIINQNDSTIIDARKISYCQLTNPEVKRIRASYYFMGSFLGLFNKVEILAPGGCNIGERPIDQHLFGFEKVGANYIYDDGKYIIDIKPKGATISFNKVSVGATINLVLLASMIDDITIIDNVATEPEVVEVCRLINQMGGYIKKVGNSTLIIYGGRKLHGITFNLIPDRIEAGTYAVIAAKLADEVTIHNIIPQHLEKVLDILKDCGVKIEMGMDYIRVKAADRLSPQQITTGPYPCFPTDLQQLFTTLLTQADGISTITEKIYADRLSHVAELRKMGSKIETHQNQLTIYGPTKLVGAEVNGKDLRGGASLVFAALLAEGKSHISGLKYINRGYHQIVENLQSLGADIQTIEVNDDEESL